ncbi:hypothetical protein [Bacillus sp. OTU530]|uniref:hypothetical protein n=1 Tax=Bacillus sp. OTU530 TaxID=3043862 RepID=UPI00313D2AAB
MLFFLLVYESVQGSIRSVIERQYEEATKLAKRINGEAVLLSLIMNETKQAANEDRS